MRKLKVKNKYFLAPMEEINDVAFRLLCKRAGAGLTYTGLTHPQTRQEIRLKDKPALQLFCTSTKGIKEFMKKHDRKVTLWDFNLGCPSVSAKKHGFGSYFEDLKMIEEILKTMRENTKKPVTVKIRKSDYAFDVLKIAEKYCDAIGVHPRTRDQGYAGEVDLEFAKEIKKKSNIPVIYSGNAHEKNAEELLETFDYIMFGREAIGRPQLFSKLNNKKIPKNIGFKDYFKLAMKYKLPFKLIKLQAMNFTKELIGAKKIRLAIYQSHTLDQIQEVLDKHIL